MILFQCVIPGRPGILKNGKQIVFNRKTGQRFVKASDKYEIFAQAATQYIKSKVPKEIIDFPVNVQFLFYFRNHQHEPDLSNAYQGLEDLLQKCGVIEDDKLIYSHDGSRKVFGSKEDRIEITITPVKEFQAYTDIMN